MAKKQDLVTAETAQHIMANISTEINEERDLVNQLLGQIQMADAFSKFSKTVFTSKMMFVKENKLYQSLKGKKSEDGLELSGTWEEFCKLLGWTPQHANEAIVNLKEFGEEAFESMSRMGIGYRELRQFRKLPEDEKQALIELAKEGDKEGFAEVAESLIAKHVKEKEQLTNDLAEKAASYEALSKVTEGKSKELDKVKTDLTKLKKRINTMAPQDIGEALRAEATDLINATELQVRGAFYQALQALTDHQAETGIDHSAFIAGLFAQVKHAINEVGIALEIKETPDTDPIPPFLREGAEAEALEAIKAAEVANDE